MKVTEMGRKEKALEPGGALGYLLWPNKILHSRCLIFLGSICKNREALQKTASHMKEAALDVLKRVAVQN